jgi:hypothetical protein
VSAIALDVENARQVMKAIVEMRISFFLSLMNERTLTGFSDGKAVCGCLKTGACAPRS